MQVCGKDIWIDGKLVRVAAIDGEGYQFLDDPEAAAASLRKSGAKADVFTFTQKLSETSPKYSYPMELDNMAAIPITTFDDWMKNRIDSKTRNMVRKAGKSMVEVRDVPLDEALVRGISNIYNESPVRQGRPFWHYNKSLEDVHKMNGTFPNQSTYLGAFLGGELIGFVKLVSTQDRTQAGLMQIISMIKHRDKAPTNALIAAAVRHCADSHISFLWYAKFSYGKKQQDSLADFKRHNGFQKIEFPRFYVPLTLRGRIALQLGLHHPMADRIPEPLMAAYRQVRAFWYRTHSERDAAKVHG